MDFGYGNIGENSKDSRFPLLQTREIWYEKCDSTNFEEKERKETIKLGIALAV